MLPTQCADPVSNEVVANSGLSSLSSSAITGNCLLGGSLIYFSLYVLTLSSLLLASGVLLAVNVRLMSLNPVTNYCMGGGGGGGVTAEVETFADLINPSNTKHIHIIYVKKQHNYM